MRKNNLLIYDNFVNASVVSLLSVAPGDFCKVFSGFTLTIVKDGKCFIDDFLR